MRVRKIFNREIQRSQDKNEDSVKAYLSQIKEPLLSAEQEKDLFSYLQKGGSFAEAVRDLVIEANLSLVVSIVKRYYRPNSFLSFGDLISAGNIGLLKAVDRFRVSEETRFSTYATYWIRQSVQREVANTKTAVRIPIHRGADVLRYKKAQKAISARGDVVAFESVAQEMGMSLEKIRRIEHANIELFSLDYDALDDGSEKTMYDRVASPIGETPHAGVIRERGFAQCIRVIKESNVLTDEEQDIIFARFGITHEGGESITLENLGKTRGVTRERVRQIQEIALEKLRKAHMPMFEDMRDAEANPV